MKPNKLKITIAILSILLILALGYIGISTYNQSQFVRQQQIFEQGAQLGYQQAILQLMQQALTCQPVPVFANNQTLNLIAVECLQQPQQTE
jgi:hypothetical protein